ncbi:hypothetical protein ES332_A13G031000v1 [Gossypium tomentosum]|uniref:Uncharacterized protein n=1 Tax=Gossypium tomentosum TaxID=34277 RepID=A0A5D2MFL5_GOSTO|nr:hypothetical protein ES332_A13G031000v1 [Gossypium tomentosum]
MVIKSSFSVILCFSLLASAFFLYEISSRKLTVVPDGNGRSKAAVKRSHSKRASSSAGYNVPPPSTAYVNRGIFNRNKHGIQCGSDRAYSSCLPKTGGNLPNQSGTYKRSP